MKRTCSVRGKRQNRRGATVVEFAICAPVLFLFVFAGIEFARANMLRNTIENAAYEGARRGIVPGATADDCRNASQALLDILNVQGSTIKVNPTVILSSTETITVSIQVPMTAENGYLTPQFYLGKTLGASITLTRET